MVKKGNRNLEILFEPENPKYSINIPKSRQSQIWADF